MERLFGDTIPLSTLPLDRCQRMWLSRVHDKVVPNSYVVGLCCETEYGK